jgi:hypothetical protein
MTAHTPGPWAVAKNIQGYPSQIVAPNGNPGPGGILAITRSAAITFPSSAEGRANARLMAAAPEMLEALEKIERNITGDPRVAIETARAAIAIAKWINK